MPNVNAFRIPKYRLHKSTGRGGHAATTELGNFKAALKVLRRLYADEPARSFGPLKLKAARQEMVRRGWMRTTINRQTGRLRHVFKWAESNEMVPPGTHHALHTVAGLRAGRSAAREPEPVRPAEESMVEQVLPHLSTPVATMVRLQLLTAVRPGKVCISRPCDLDTSDDVWVYTPAAHKTAHKTAHHGHERRVLLGRSSQAVLAPFLHRSPAAYCFNPAEAEAERRAELTKNRRTPRSCGNRPGTNRVRTPIRTPGERYDASSYRRAVQRGCDAAGVDRFHPHQFRHTAATNIRRNYGLEAAQVILGHRHARTTEIYAEANVAKAEAVMREVG